MHIPSPLVASLNIDLNRLRVELDTTDDFKASVAKEFSKQVQTLAQRVTQTPPDTADKVKECWDQFADTFIKEIPLLAKKLDQIKSLENRIQQLKGDDAKYKNGMLKLLEQLKNRLIGVSNEISGAEVQYKAKIFDLLASRTALFNGKIPDRILQAFERQIHRTPHDPSETIVKGFVASVVVAAAINSLGYKLPIIQETTKKALAITGRTMGAAIEHGGGFAVDCLASGTNLVMENQVMRDAVLYLTALGVGVSVAESAAKDLTDTLTKKPWAAPLGILGLGVVMTNDGFRNVASSIFSPNAAYYVALLASGAWAKRQIKPLIPKSLADVPSTLYAGFNFIRSKFQRDPVNIEVLPDDPRPLRLEGDGSGPIIEQIPNGPHLTQEQINLLSSLSEEQRQQLREAIQRHQEEPRLADELVRDNQRPPQPPAPAANNHPPESPRVVV